MVMIIWKVLPKTINGNNFLSPDENFKHKVEVENTEYLLIIYNSFYDIE